VALKILRPELVGGRRWTARLAREVNLAGQLHLSRQPRGPATFADQLRSQDLDGHVLAQNAVVGPKDDADSTTPEHTEDLVTPRQNAARTRVQAT